VPLGDIYSLDRIPSPPFDRCHRRDRHLVGRYSGDESESVVLAFRSRP